MDDGWLASGLSELSVALRCRNDRSPCRDHNYPRPRVRQVVGPVSSLFWHFGKSCQGEDFNVTLKTTDGRYAELEAHIIANQPWDKPEVTTVELVRDPPAILTGSRTRPRPGPARAAGARACATGCISPRVRARRLRELDSQPDRAEGRHLTATPRR
ncbi:divalent cation tolerance protein CutA [Amycolatopsis thailandensis]|uniref:divalent cation tolerance protein CutA n=1 Tax=Amycolatopsis thailandensis TaxID=589330 RepID=UPI001FCA1BB4|nr:divalent cation tolerance protein CutA [Amycolatopsis thailandensis]